MKSQARGTTRASVLRCCVRARLTYITDFNYLFYMYATAIVAVFRGVRQRLRDRSHLRRERFASRMFAQLFI